MIRLNVLTRWNELRAQPVVIYGIHHFPIFMFVFLVLGHLYYYGPGALEHQVALQIMNHKIPYIDFPSEYPPLAYISFLLPAMFFKAQLSYSVAFALEFLIADIVILAIISSLARRLKLSVMNTLFVYTLLILAVGPLVIVRYDLLPAMLTLAGIYAFVTNRSHIAWVLIALGTAAKFYPAIIIPLFALYHLRQKQYGRLIVGGAMFLAVTLAVVSPWLVLNAKSLFALVNYHAQRGIQCESTYATVLMVLQTLKLTKVQGVFNFGSWNLVSPLADKLAGYSTYITIGALLIVYILYGWRLLKTPVTNGQADSIDRKSMPLILIFSSLAVTVFLLGNKVFSPQYLIWLCPLLPLTTGQWRLSVLVLFLLVAAITQYIFPYHYVEYESFKPYLTYMGFARNLILAVIMVLLALSPGILNKSKVKQGK